MKWHKTADKLPRYNTCVLICLTTKKDKLFLTAFRTGFNGDDTWGIFSTHDDVQTNFPLNYFTHWTEIDPPEEGK